MENRNLKALLKGVVFQGSFFKITILHLLNHRLTNVKHGSTMKKYVSYYRVSTQRQGASGLGLEAQRSTVLCYIGTNELIAEFTEIESGNNNHRPELKRAIKKAVEEKATLIIAKLDRLSRNVGFIFSLKDAGVDFIACDMPEANTMTLGVMAVMAQQEREFISERTKKALTVKMNQGVKLGKPENLTESARIKSLEVRQNSARNNDNNRKAFALAKQLFKQGVTLNAIAKELNNYHYKSSKGKTFQAVQVKRLLVMFEQN